MTLFEIYFGIGYILFIIYGSRYERISFYPCNCHHGRLELDEKRDYENRVLIVTFHPYTVVISDKQEEDSEGLKSIFNLPRPLQFLSSFLLWLPLVIGGLIFFILVKMENGQP